MIKILHMLTLRAAKPEDISLLKRWDTDPVVMTSVPLEWWDWDKELSTPGDWREMFIAEDDGHAIGFVQVMNPVTDPDQYWGPVTGHVRAIDIWIGEADARNRGYGTEMMKQAIEICFADPRVTHILIDPLASNTEAHRFYERLGFRFVERRRFGDDDCFVFTLQRPSP